MITLPPNAPDGHTLRVVCPPSADIDDPSADTSATPSGLNLGAEQTPRSASLPLQTADGMRREDAEVDACLTVDIREVASRSLGGSAQFLPTAELGTNGISACVRDAVVSLAGPERHPSMNAGKTLKRSERFWAAVEPAKRDLLQAVHADLGDVDDAPQTLLGLADAYSEARLFRTAMYLRLIDTGGPITGKGRTKALYTAYLGALDRETRLAQLLGLTRRSKKVQTAADLLEVER